MRVFAALLLMAVALPVLAQGGANVVEVKGRGVKGDGRTVCTAALNRAIARAPEGSVVRIPAGRYVTGTLHLKSHLTLELAEGAELVGSERLEDYEAYVPTHDMSRYDTDAGTRNANLTGDARWTRALILGVGLEDVHICGGGTIDGRHVEDSLGEENMRGPHGILLAECRDVSVRGINIRRASNYAILGYELDSARFEGLHISEGWDGVHIRGGRALSISGCTIETGDDAVAGGYWTGMKIEGCVLNSSCNGVRVIEPVDGLEVSGCRIYGPGLYPHRTGRGSVGTGMIYGVVIEPGAWGDAPGVTRGVEIHDVSIEGTWGPVAYSMGADNECVDLTLRNVSATKIRGVAQPINRQECVRSWTRISIDNVECTK